MEKLVKDIPNEIIIKSKHFKISEKEQLKTELKQEVENNQTNSVFLLIDVCLEEEESKRVPIPELESVKIVKTLNIDTNRVCFYSNMFENGIDELFSVVEGCHFLAITGAAIDAKNKNYNAYEKNRKRYRDHIHNYINNLEG